MKQFLSGLFLSCFLAASGLAHAEPALIPPAPPLKARGYILMDHHSGYIMAQSNAEARLEPASLTKIMTAYVVAAELAAGRVHEPDPVRISERAWRMEGSRTFAEVGKTIPLIELLKGVIVQSGNDASVALAEHIAGSEESFAALMNSHAQRLGLKDTHFVNATGLPHPQHYSTARDLALLARAVVRDYPQHYALYSIKEYTHNNIVQHNRNQLLRRDPSVDGLKTGHTESAGYCLVSSAQRDGMRLISVVLGTDSDNTRTDESQKLLTYGFRFFETRRLYAAGTSLSTARVWKGESKEVSLGLTEDFYVTLPRGQYPNLNASISVPDRITAPLQKGTRIGAVNVMLGGKPLVQRALFALQAVPEGGLFRSLADRVVLMFE